VHCPKINPNTDSVYRQLAAHRAQIEAALAVDPEMSIRKALALFRKSRPKPPEADESPLVGLWEKADVVEKMECLEADTADAIREYLPPDKLRALADRIAHAEGSRRRTAHDRELSKRVRDLIRHLIRREADEIKTASLALRDYVSDEGIDVAWLEVRVDAADAPAVRRDPLVSRPQLVVDNDRPNPPV
jgi:hypothetical protein